MDGYLIAILFIGLIFGSFLSVIVSRLDQKSGLFFGRSECPNCLAKLKWYDLFPVFSFLVLKGKCRYCGDNISWLYPVMELAVASSFLLYCGVNGQCFNLAGAYWLIIIFFLLTLTFFDYVHFILPDKLILTVFSFSLLYHLIFTSESIKNGLLTGLALGGFFVILFMCSRGEWMGFGDVKLAFLIGFVLGYPMALWAIIAATWSGALWGLGMMAVGRASLKTPLPFGTFMSATTILLIIFKKYVEYFSPIL